MPLGPLHITAQSNNAFRTKALCGVSTSGIFLIDKYIYNPDYYYCELCVLLNLSREVENELE